MSSHGLNICAGYSIINFVLTAACVSGGLLYLLNLFCNSLNPDVRQQTAELFAKLAADKLNGPKVSSNMKVAINMERK